jgi:RNA-directed DNA polymerase
MESKDVFYVRYMDDVLVMSHRRWGLRRAVKRLNRILGGLNLEKHPAKTFVGRIEKGFDFLGYHFGRADLRLAGKTIANAAEKIHRLYEQKQTARERAVALDEYLTRWKRWVTAGLGGLAITITAPSGYTETTEPYTQ